jgi:hypothetical protein
LQAGIGVKSEAVWTRRGDEFQTRSIQSLMKQQLRFRSHFDVVNDFSQ